jgi:type IV pilus biogenesis protein CpaD/CtpE
MLNLQTRHVLAMAAAVALLCSGCASTGSGSGPRSPAQLKQQELSQMQSQGQRNDIDKPFK